MTVKWFKDDDAGYLQWCARHPDGRVANTRRSINANYLVLHVATCRAITEHLDMELKPGGFTTRGYSKVCADSEAELRSELQRRTGKPQPFSSVCRCVGLRAH